MMRPPKIRVLCIDDIWKRLTPGIAALIARNEIAVPLRVDDG
jgi:hypothetical protein